MDQLITKAKGLAARFLHSQGIYEPDRMRSDRLLRYYFYKEIFDHAKGVEGDIVECGVAYGQSLIAWGTLTQAEGKNRTIWAYDSYEGFPEPTGEDQSVRNPKKGEYNDATIARVQSVLKKARVPEPVYVKGFFEDTVKNHSGKIAILYVDADLYESTKTVLEALADKVVPGGVIGFDDYNDPNWPGAKKAIDEYFKGAYPIIKGEYVNKYYLIKK